MYGYETIVSSGGGPRHSRYFQCEYPTQHLSDCANRTDTSHRSQSPDVGINCYRGYCYDGDMRLVDGETNWEGRLEMCQDGRWGTIAAESETWGETNYRFACNALGFGTRVNSSIPHSLSKPVFLSNVKCQNTTLSLLQCGYSTPQIINTIEDVRIHCEEALCKDGQIRLVGGGGHAKGQLQYGFSHRWTAVK
ncbi:Scavenger receptor cysteine-rich type 1 protein M160, partial [Geodia barretti]